LSALLAIEQLSSRQPGRSAEIALRETVRRLARCLGQLPDELRLVLQLRTGIGTPHPLTRVAVATYLHTSAKRVTRMERRALRLLRSAARTNACGRGAVAGDARFALAGFGPPGQAGGATGEVEAVRSASSASHRSSGAWRAATHGDSLLGIKAPPEAGQALGIAMITLASLLVVAILFGDRLPLGPRFQEWRSRWVRRPPP
jgi:hypothetical protein